MYREEIRKWKFGRDSTSVNNFQAAQKNFQETLLQKEIFWRQRSKHLWLQAGDKNSKFFHATASARRHQNTISQLRNLQGDWVS